MTLWRDPGSVRYILVYSECVLDTFAETSIFWTFSNPAPETLRNLETPWSADLAPQQQARVAEPLRWDTFVDPERSERSAHPTGDGQVAAFTIPSDTDSASFRRTAGGRIRRPGY